MPTMLKTSWWTPVCAGIEKDGVKFLEFEKGKKDYLEWIEKTFPINKD